VRALYGALKDLMDLFKSGKIALPAVDFTPAAVELAYAPYGQACPVRT